MIDRKRALKALLRKDFRAFAVKVFRYLEPSASLQMNWHLDALAHQLDLVCKGEMLRSIVNMPPRSAKSIYGVALCAFVHGHNPTAKIACMSYSSELAAKLARQYRAVLQSHWYRELFPRARIGSEKNSESEIELTAGGFRLAWSVTGTITGRGADLIIVDDPIKAEDALSEAVRTSVNETFDGTVLSRLDNKATGAIVVMMQRLHADDLSGHLLAKGGWTHLKLPAITDCDRDIPIGGGRTHIWRAGEALHPEREPVELLRRYKADLGTLRFSAQFLQDPIPPEGNVIKWAWFRTYDAPPGRGDGRIVQSWDTASKVGAANAYSVCVTFLRREQHHFLLHVLRQQLGYPDLRKTVIDHARQWRAETLLIEDAALGTPLIQELRGDPSAPQPIAVRAEGDKLTRMGACSAMIEAGSVYLPLQAEWLGDFRAELLQFPHSARKDQVDALSQYLNWAKAPAKPDFEWDFLDP